MSYLYCNHCIYRESLTFSFFREVVQHRLRRRPVHRVPCGVPCVERRLPPRRSPVSYFDYSVVFVSCIIGTAEDDQLSPQKIYAVLSTASVRGRVVGADTTFCKIFPLIYCTENCYILILLLLVDVRVRYRKLSTSGSRFDGDTRKKR